MPKAKMPSAVFMALTLGPAIAIGATIWFVNDLFPECLVGESQRLAAPDGQFDLVTFSRNCGATTTANTQAALVPSGEVLPADIASFVSVGSEADLQPRWDAYGNIELSLPPGAEIFLQNDTVAGISVIYR